MDTCIDQCAMFTYSIQHIYTINICVCTFLRIYIDVHDMYGITHNKKDADIPVLATAAGASNRSWELDSAVQVHDGHNHDQLQYVYQSNLWECAATQRMGKGGSPPFLDDHKSSCHVSARERLAFWSFAARGLGWSLAKC